MIKNFIENLKFGFFLFVGLITGQPYEYFVIHSEILKINIEEFFIRIRYCYNLYSLRKEFKLKKKIRYIIFLIYTRIYLYFKMNSLNMAIVPQIGFYYDAIDRFYDFFIEAPFFFEPLEVRFRDFDGDNGIAYYKINPEEREDYEGRVIDYTANFLDVQYLKALKYNIFYMKKEQNDFNNLYKQYSYLIKEEEDFQILMKDINECFTKNIDSNINFELVLQYFIMINNNQNNDFYLYINKDFQDSYELGLNIENGLLDEELIKYGFEPDYMLEEIKIAEKVVFESQQDYRKVEEGQINSPEQLDFIVKGKRDNESIDDYIAAKLFDGFKLDVERLNREFNLGWEMNFQFEMKELIFEPIEDTFLYYTLNGFYYLGVQQSTGGSLYYQIREQQFGIWNLYSLYSNLDIENDILNKLRLIMFLRWLKKDNKHKNKRIDTVAIMSYYSPELNNFLFNECDSVYSDYSIMMNKNVDYPLHYSGLMHFFIRNLIMGIICFYLLIKGTNLFIQYKFDFYKLFPDRWEIVDTVFVNDYDFLFKLPDVDDILPEVFFIYLFYVFFLIGLMLLMSKSVRIFMRFDLSYYLCLFAFIIDTVIDDVHVGLQVYGFDIWWSLQMPMDHPLYIFIVDDNENDLTATSYEGYSSRDYNYEEDPWEYIEWTRNIEFFFDDLRVTLNDYIFILQQKYFDIMAPIVLDWYFGFFCAEKEMNRTLMYFLENKAICGYLAFYTIFLVVFCFAQLLWWLYQKIKYILHSI